MSRNGISKSLGMDQPISRRDFVSGAAAALSAAALPLTGCNPKIVEAAAYPPAVTGMRGNHPGSFEVAHALARHGQRDWGDSNPSGTENFDLVVVGAGVSGLSAAWFHLKKNPNDQVLIIDNHDDFGGHARRNELSAGGRTLLSYGGSQTLQEPSGYSSVVKQLMADLDVDISRFDQAYDQDFFRRHELAGGIFFEKQAWGTNKLVRYDLSKLRSYIPLAESPLAVAHAVAQMPLSEAAREELIRLISSTEDCLPGMPRHEREDYLYTLSYRQFLADHMRITQPDVFRVLQDLTSDSSAGIESTSAGFALFYTALPGLLGTGLRLPPESEPYIHHFPDGNASIARLLVRKLIPEAAEGNDMEDIVTARFDYGKLDADHGNVRLRLNSTAVRVRNLGSGTDSTGVAVTYVKDGKTREIKASACVLACYNRMIPSLCPEMPQAQRQALAHQVKSPILYTSVALRNWRAFKELGIGAFVSPGGYHVNAMLDFPVSLGAYQFSENPDAPVVVHMERFPHRPNEGYSIREQRRLGRQELLATPFSDIEQKIRTQLAGALEKGGFDPAEDITAITVNRWAHGYADGYSDLEDPYYENPDDERYPHVQGRKRFGRIAIANSDAAARAMLEAAVEQAHRAIEELS